MAGRSMPSEESLGLSPTEDELNTVVTHDDDDVPLNEANEPALAPAKPGPEKAAKPEPEAQETEKAAEPGKTEEEQPKQVDVRALQEARAEAREAKRQSAILEQRWNDFLAYQQQTQKAEPKQEPELPQGDDPLARINWIFDQMVEGQKQAKVSAVQTEQQQAFQRAYDGVNADLSASMKEDPTIGEAHQALRQSLGAELLAMGYTEAQARAEITKIENQHIVYMAQNGVRPGDHIKAMATARGWKATEPQAAVQPKTDIAAVAAAQQRHQSLSDAGGGEAVAPLDAKALGRMTDKEFKAWMSKKGNEAKFDEIMGA